MMDYLTKRSIFTVRFVFITDLPNLALSIFFRYCCKFTICLSNKAIVLSGHNLTEMELGFSPTFDIMLHKYMSHIVYLFMGVDLL